MTQIKLSLAVAMGLMTGLLAWAGAPSSDSYVKVEASSLVRTPQNSWARAILFSDVLIERPAGRVKRLDRKNYLPMKLKDAGTTWVKEDLALKFQKLETGKTYSFAGTVDQISRRYYVIVDACYIIQTAENMDEQWTDMLNPDPSESLANAEDLKSTGMQTLLLEAQNSLIKMAAENNMTVAQLIEAQTDGGQRIAENIVAVALQGELRAQQKTADEMMIGAVLALLQKESILEESAKLEAANEALRIAEANKESSPPATPEGMSEDITPIPEPVAEEVATVTAEEPEPTIEVKPEEAPPVAEPMKEEGTVVAAKEEMAESQAKAEEIVPAPIAEPVAEEVTTVSLEEVLPTPEVKVEETPPMGEAASEENIAFAMEVPAAKSTPEENKKAGQAEEVTPMAEPGQESLELPPPATVEEEIEIARVSDLIAPDGLEAGGDSVAAPPSSMLVVPMSDPQPEMVPLVSMEPTKAELARMKKQAALDKRERVLAEKKAAAQEAKAKKIAAKKAKAEKKRIAAAKKKAAAVARAEEKRLAAAEKIALAETRAAEKARVKAEKGQAREEAAAKKVAEAKVRKEAQLAEAAAKKAQAEEAKRLDLEEKRALEAAVQAEMLKKQAEGARLMREDAEARLAELTARKAEAETAMREMDAKKQTALQELRNETEARAAQQAAELAQRLAEEKAKIEDGIRIAKEVAAHEQKMAAEATSRFDAEVAARKAAEEKILQLEAETRQMELDMRRAQANLKREIEVQRKALEAGMTQGVKETEAEIEALQPQVALPKADTLTPAEKRKQKADEKKAKKAAAKEKKRQAKREAKEAKKAAKAAAIEAQSKKDIPSSIDTDDLPEWMQPVQF